MLANVGGVAKIALGVSRLEHFVQCRLVESFVRVLKMYVLLGKSGRKLFRRQRGFGIAEAKKCDWKNVLRQSE